MTYCRISAHTVITCPNLHNLIAAWQTYGRDPITAMLVSFRCESLLTESQRKRLPAALREKLIAG